MAMIPCMECGKEVSDQALKCPGCGVQLRKPKRTFMGKVFKWLFIIFNAFMLFSLVQGIGGASEIIGSAKDDIEQAGAVIGTGLGMSMLLSLWVMGDIILGLFVLFTRPKG